jgi:hypothetical protein
MKILLCGLFSVAVLISSYGIAFADKDDKNKSKGHGGWNGVAQASRSGSRAVPIPGALMLFGGGFAGFVAWRWRKNRHSKD